MMIIDDELMTMNQLRMFVRMTVGLITFPTVMFVVMVMVLTVIMPMIVGDFPVNVV